jgi:hypothetical protein
VQRNFRKRIGGNGEVLRQDLRRRVGEPVRQEQGIELRRLSVVEREDELAAVRAEPLQRVRQACGKIPEIAFLHVGHISSADFVENGNTAICHWT